MTAHNRKRRYGEEFLPVDEGMIINRGVLHQWFDDKKNVVGSKWIDDWLNSAIAENNAMTGKELETVEQFLPNINIGKVNDRSTNDASTEIQGYDSLETVQEGECNDAKNVFKYNFGKIVRSRITKRQQREDHVLPSNSKRKAFVTIKKEIRITCYTSSDNESVDTAEYIRGARGKGNKSLQGKNNLIKQHSDMKNMESNKTFQANGNIKISQQKNTLEDSESLYYNKIRRKRFQKRCSRKLNNSRLHSSSSSSSDNVFSRHPTDIQNSCSLSRLNLIHKYNSSEETDNSDPDYKILDKVRKSHNVIVKPVVVNSSKKTTQAKPATILDQTAEPIIEFPSEPEHQFQVNNSTESEKNKQNILSYTSEEYSETDVLFMSNRKRFCLYGKCFVDQPRNSHSNLQSDWELNEPSTDDSLFKHKN